VLLLLLMMILLGFTDEARAASAPFIELESACPTTAEALERRVTEGLVGERDPELGAAITIRETQGGYEVALRTSHGAATLATKVVTAPSCEEAVEAATVVLALALGESAPRLAPPAARAPPEPPAPAAPVWRSAVSEPRVDRRRQPQPQPLQMSDSLRLALSTGVDAATLPASTAYVAAGLSRSFADVEWYGVLRYGAPHIDESARDADSERTRLDFAALEVGACYGLGRHLRVSACASSELGVVRITRSLRWSDGTALETDVVRPRLSGVLTALLAYRGGLIEPQLELAAVVLAAEARERSPLVGLKAAENKTVGLRAGLGAAVPF
jgi:hypothetical protein